MTFRKITKHCVNAFNQKHVEVYADEADSPYRYEISVKEDEKSAPLFDQSPRLRFQHGEALVNGITNEALIAVVIDRLERFQEGPYKCRENALTITKLEEALLWQGARAARIEMEDRDEGIKAP